MASRMESKSQHPGTIMMSSEVADKLEERYPHQLIFVPGEPVEVKMKGEYTINVKLHCNFT